MSYNVISELLLIRDSDYLHDACGTTNRITRINKPIRKLLVTAGILISCFETYNWNSNF
jgi:hypothetical protein